MAMESLSAILPHPQAFAELSLNAVVTSNIGGIPVRCMLNGGELWMIVQDLLKAFGYRHPRTSDLRYIFRNHGYDLSDFSIGVPLGKRGLVIINQDGVRLACKLVKERRSQDLLRWLEDGGMRNVSRAELPTSQHLEKAGGGTTNVPTSAHLPTPTPSDLQPGDRVMHTGNGDFGTVKQIYPDGSASVLWDGWEAAGAGVSLAIPREGMELVSHAELPTSAVEDSQRGDYGRSLNEPVIGEKTAKLPTSSILPESNAATSRHLPPADAHGFASAARDLRNTMSNRLYEVAKGVRRTRAVLNMLLFRFECLRRQEGPTEDELCEIEDMVEIALNTLPHHYNDLLDPLEGDLRKMSNLEEAPDKEQLAQAARLRIQELLGSGAPAQAGPAAS